MLLPCPHEIYEVASIVIPHGAGVVYKKMFARVPTVSERGTFRFWFHADGPEYPVNIRIASGVLERTLKPHGTISGGTYMLSATPTGPHYELWQSRY